MLTAHKKHAVLGRGALLLTTLIWGTSFVILKNALDGVSAIYLLAFRFSLAAIIMAAAGFKSLKAIDRGTLFEGILLGLFIFLAYVLQTYGLVYTTPGVNAFLTATYCVITPFLMRPLLKTRISRYNILAAVLCIIGIGFVSLKENLSIGLGELLTICCGFFYALHIITSAKAAPKRSLMALNILQFLFAAVFSWIAALITGPVPKEIPSGSVISIIYLSVFCTCICFGFQMFGQKYTSAATASIILTLESVFGALISALFYGEKMPLRLIFGFALIFSAIIASETKLSFLFRSQIKSEASDNINNIKKTETENNTQ